MINIERIEPVTLKAEDKVIHPGIPEFAYDIGPPIGAADRKGICDRRSPAPIPFGSSSSGKSRSRTSPQIKTYSLAMASAVR